MNLSDKSKFLLERFYSGNLGIEATIFHHADSITNNVINCLSSTINHTCALHCSPLCNFYVVICISHDRC